jgi:hypothetical protein
MITAEFTRRAKIMIGDTTGMILDVAVEAAAYRKAFTVRSAALTVERAAMAAVEACPAGKGSGRARAALRSTQAASDDAEAAQKFAAAAVECAIRATNPGRPMVDVMAAKEAVLAS